MKTDEQSEPESESPDALELQGRLADAVNALRASPIEPALIERCRLAAFAAGEAKAVRSRIRVGWPGVGSFAVAAAVLLMLNLFQAWLRMPASDVELAAIRVTREGIRMGIYSDLRVEPLAVEPAVKNGSER